MQHALSQIAKNYQFDVEKFIEFGKKNHLKYSIIIDTNVPTVSTLRSDELVEDFKKENNINE